MEFNVDFDEVVVDQLFDVFGHKDNVDTANSELINDKKSVNDCTIGI